MATFTVLFCLNKGHFPFLYKNINAFDPSFLCEMLSCYPDDRRSLCTDHQMFTKCMHLCKVLSDFYLDVLILHPFSKCSAIARRQTSFPSQSFLSLSFRCLGMPCGNPLTQGWCWLPMKYNIFRNIDPHCQRTHSSFGSMEEKERERVNGIYFNSLTFSRNTWCLRRSPESPRCPSPQP